jgi:crotonobetainyl-CoA:carnitine CoA-transferase CaiB-like acyl-CoA transferase
VGGGHQAGEHHAELTGEPGARPAPALGEHTDALLRELGYDGARIRVLKDSRII